MHVLPMSSAASSKAGIRSLRVFSRLIACTLGASAIVAAAGCKEATADPKVSKIVGMAAVDSVRQGRNYTFAVELQDASGKKLTGRKVNWSSLNSQIASVDENGIATGLVVGNTIISARVDNASAQTNLFVQPLVTSVVVFPATAAMPLGSTRTLTVTVSDKNGIALTGRTVAFSSSNPAVATVNGSGVVVATSIGRAVISAKAVQDDVTGTATIDVVQAPVASVTITPAGSQTVFQGLTLQLSATLRDNNQPPNILTGRTINWNTSNPSIATVSNTGLVTGVALGSTQITAESEGVTGGVTIAVQPRPVATVAVSPNPATVKVGAQVQLTLDLRDANGNPLTTAGRSVTWESSNMPIATVNNGVVTGVSAGTATITVTVDGKSASSAVTVTPGP